MLVPLKLVQQWYHRSHPVYLNFAYLWCNDLWSKPVPNGFAVCPFAWLSLFSLCVFRPLIVWPILALRWCVRAVHLTDALRFVDKHAHRASFIEPRPALGFNTALMIWSWMMVCGVLFLLSYFIYQPYVLASGAGAPGLYWTAVALILGSIIAALVDDRSPNLRTIHVRRAFWAYASILLTMALVSYPDLTADLRRDIWYIVTEGAAWGWNLIISLSTVVATFWYMPVIFFGVFALTYGIMVWLDRAPNPWTLRDDWLLRATRTRVREWIVERTWQRFWSKGSTPGETRCRAFISQSKTMRRTIRSIVDSLSWRNVTDLSISISQERLDDFVEQVYAEWQVERDVSARLLAQIEAKTLRLKNSRVARGLERVRLMVRYGAKQVLTLGCVVWELIKAKKNRSCPWMPFSGTIGGQPYLDDAGE